MSNEMNWMRRKFLQVSSLFGAGFLLNDTASAQHEQHRAPKTDKKNGKTAEPGRDHRKTPEQAQQAPGEYAPVVTPDLPKLEYKIENGVKVFNLTAEVIECELMPKTHMGPARKMNAWGYNGSVPGPTIEVNEGDRVRVIFDNKLPEPTTIHWHGLEIPIEMDGTPYISQPMVDPGGMFIYEFTVNQNGTFFYHSHGAMQEMMGMIGLFVIHPKVPHTPRVDKDYRVRVAGVGAASQQQHAEHAGHGVQLADDERQGRARDHADDRQAGRARAHPPRQSRHGSSPDPPARRPVLRHRHGRRAHPRIGLVSGQHRPRRRGAGARYRIRSEVRSAIGCCIATCRTT